MNEETYAVNTTRNREFEVEAELKDMHLRAWVPRALGSKYVPEKRAYVWFDKAYVSKLVFCVIPARYFRDVLAIKHVIGKPEPLTRRDIEGVPAHTKSYDPTKHVPAVPGLIQFRAMVEAEYADMKRRQANAEYQCKYVPGQALELLAGSFEGFPAKFQRAIRRAHDDYSRIQVEVEMFGQSATVEIDPDKVKAAE